MGHQQHAWTLAQVLTMMTISFAKVNFIPFFCYIIFILACHSNCLTCYGGDFNDCLTCPD